MWSKGGEKTKSNERDGKVFWMWRRGAQKAEVSQKE